MKQVYSAPKMELCLLEHDDILTYSIMGMNGDRYVEDPFGTDLSL